MMDYIYKMGIAYSVHKAVKHVLHKLYALHVSLDIHLVLNHAYYHVCFLVLLVQMITLNFAIVVFLVIY